MTLHILTRAADGTQHSYQFPHPRSPFLNRQAILSALELTGPGATFVRTYTEGDW